MPGTLSLKNLKLFESCPVSNGVLIFAINSSFDYISAAAFAAKQAKKYLNLPVTLVTTTEVKLDIFDSVIVIDDNNYSQRNYVAPNGQSTLIQWFNESRVNAYDLSPYDKTLLIDADYFMFNSSLQPIFDTDIELACYNEVNDVSGITPPVNRLNAISIPMQWATVLYFQKCELAKAVFDFMKLIKKDWEYYSILYSFRNHNFRNDFALSIALQVLTGYSTKNFNQLPGKLHTIFSDTDVVEVEGSNVIHKHNQLISKISGTNIHCINKEAMEKFYA